MLYRVSGGNPGALLYAETPAYRSLPEYMTGSAVEELNADLVVLGYVTSTELSPTSDQFTWWTKAGVEKFQTSMGVTATGPSVSAKPCSNPPHSESPHCPSPWAARRSPASRRWSPLLPHARSVSPATRPSNPKGRWGAG